MEVSRKKVRNLAGKLQERLKRRRAVKQEAFNAAVEAGRILFGSDRDAYREYLIENGASEIEAESIVNSRYNGQRLSGKYKDDLPIWEQT